VRNLCNVMKNDGLFLSFTLPAIVRFSMSCLGLLENGKIVCPGYVFSEDLLQFYEKY